MSLFFSFHRLYADVQQNESISSQPCDDMTRALPLAVSGSVLEHVTAVSYVRSKVE